MAVTTDCGCVYREAKLSQELQEQKAVSIAQENRQLVAASQPFTGMPLYDAVKGEAHRAAPAHCQSLTVALHDHSDTQVVHTVRASCAAAALRVVL